MTLCIYDNVAYRWKQNQPSNFTFTLNSPIEREKCDYHLQLNFPPHQFNYARYKTTRFYRSYTKFAYKVKIEANDKNFLPACVQVCEKSLTIDLSIFFLRLYRMYSVI